MDRVVNVEKVFSPQRNLKVFTHHFRHIQRPVFMKNNKRYCSNRKKLATQGHQKQHIKKQQQSNTPLGVFRQDVHASNHSESVYAVIKG